MPRFGSAAMNQTRARSQEQQPTALQQSDIQDTAWEGTFISTDPFLPPCLHGQARFAQPNSNVCSIANSTSSMRQEKHDNMQSQMLRRRKRHQRSTHGDDYAPQPAQHDLGHFLFSDASSMTREELLSGNGMDVGKRKYDGATTRMEMLFDDHVATSPLVQTTTTRQLTQSHQLQSPSQVQSPLSRAQMQHPPLLPLPAFEDSSSECSAPWFSPAHQVLEEVCNELTLNRSSQNAQLLVEKLNRHVLPLLSNLPETPLLEHAVHSRTASNASSDGPPAVNQYIDLTGNKEADECLLIMSKCRCAGKKMWDRTVLELAAGTITARDKLHRYFTQSDQQAIARTLRKKGKARRQRYNDYLKKKKEREPLSPADVEVLSQSFQDYNDARERLVGIIFSCIGKPTGNTSDVANVKVVYSGEVPRVPLETRFFSPNDIPRPPSLRQRAGTTSQSQQ